MQRNLSESHTSHFFRTGHSLLLFLLIFPLFYFVIDISQGFVRDVKKLVTQGPKKGENKYDRIFLKLVNSIYEV